MALLTIDRLGDFTLSIESAGFQRAHDRALMNLGEEALASRYDWSDREARVSLEDGSEIVPGDEKSPACFFDNTDYAVWIEFESPKRLTADPRIRSNCREVEESFCYHRSRGILSGSVNFGNDIGQAKLVLDYAVDGRPRVFVFRFEVLSQKLDYHHDWKIIVEEVERAYSMLSADYLRKTSHSFDKAPRREAPEVIWWSLFENLQDRFISACRLVLARPRRSVLPVVEPLRAEQIRRMTPQLENEWARFRTHPSHRYAGRRDELSQDTPANRFVKYALNRIRQKHERLSNDLLSHYGEPHLSDSLRERIAATRHQLKGLCANPFFKGVGPYTPVAQESFVLRRAPGYAVIARCYAMLQAAYALQEGAFDLQTKDIATLYEIWCLIQVRDIVARKMKAQLGHPPRIDDANRGELGGRFVAELGRGRQSRVLFRDGDVVLAEVTYNPETTAGESSNAIPGTVSPTGVGQRPDIVLQLSRELGDDKAFRLTYLFDAKYRIDSAAFKQGKGAGDHPPQDAINQMHRFRDAIYYESGGDAFSSSLKKEVIGGYILFPGAGGLDAVREAPFYKSIDQVNIGAFPLRPGMPESRSLLEDFIGHLLENDAPKQLENVIPQKGTFQVLERDQADVIPSGEESDAFLRVESNAELSEATRGSKVYARQMGLTPNPESVRWILVPVPHKPVRLLKVLAYRKGHLSGSELVYDYPEYGRVPFVRNTPNALFDIWSVKEV